MLLPTGNPRHAARRHNERWAALRYLEQHDANLIDRRGAEGA